MTYPLQCDRISAGTIVEHEGRLLMVRHVTPGGGIKGSESYEGAAAREVCWETGLSVHVRSFKSHRILWKLLGCCRRIH